MQKDVKRCTMRDRSSESPLSSSNGVGQRRPWNRCFMKKLKPSAPVGKGLLLVTQKWLPSTIKSELTLRRMGT